MTNLQKILQDNFKLESFREWQEEIIQSVVDGNDTLVFMPTWGWKSLTYQLPGIAREWVTLVISPLISLMKDQVDKLKELWIRAELINSTIDTFEQNMILNELSATDFSEYNHIKFLYIAPERLNSRDFLRVIQSVKIWLVAIDEAHCISAWGHDFRPSYMKIKWFLDKLKEFTDFPIVALTATATEKVRDDIVLRLWLETWKYNIFTKWFDRKNIIILVREISKKEEKLNKVLEVLNNTAWSWIIYCSSRKVVKEVYDMLISEWVKAWIYTWAMTADNREVEQNRFMTDEYKVIVATNAFGMWIDKKDIRFVIHYNLPWSIENYYQEVGRAWRDWKQSFWIVLASYWDTKIQEFFIENTYPEKKEILQFYDYLYKDFKDWEWKNIQIQKTYFTLAKESWLGNDMKAWSILKMFEKYWIIKRWIDWELDEGFRWKGITLLQEKRKHSHIMVDWNHQSLLENESYFKLDQIKKLLFYPSCRKKFILKYFWDEEDLKNLWDSCWVCDYCIDKKKLGSWKLENLVNLSVFEIVLDVLKEFDWKFWAKLITLFLRGSADKRIEDWWLDNNDNYAILSEYNSELIEAIIEWLINEWLLEKSSWKYPLLWLTKLWRVAIKNESVLKNCEEDLQQHLHMKVKNNAFKKLKSTTSTWTNWWKKSWNYNETLKLHKEWLSINDIAKKVDLKPMTIENHILKLYERWDLTIMDIMKLSDLNNLKEVKTVLEEEISDTSKLKPIKEALENKWFWKISYFEIKIAISMIVKKDL